MSIELIGALTGAVLVFAGLLLTQWLLHRRWTEEQDDKRRDEAENLLGRMADQNSSVVENALRVAQVHREDAERARVLALETAQNHAECRAEVAALAGRVEELRQRIAENERTMEEQSRTAEEDRGIKHDALSALTISEGTVHLVRTLVADCTCEAFKPIESLVSSFHPRAPALVEANARIRSSTLARVEAGVERIEAASEKVATNLAVAQAKVDSVANDLAEAHHRADATDGPPGKAADAFTQSPDP